MTDIYDFVVIGGGSAGYAGAVTATELGLRTAVVEGGEEVGGLCILRGCMPSKTLIESANRFLTIRRADEFGLRAEKVEAHPGEIIARKRRLVAEFADYRRQQLEDGPFDFIRGMASFVNENAVEVVNAAGEKRFVTGRSFLIATGSALKRINVPGLNESGFRDSDSALEWEELPSSLIILGGGATAVELAHYYSALGSHVTIIQRSDQLLSDLDFDIAKELESAFRKRGMDIFCGTELLRVENSHSEKRVYFRHAGEQKSVAANEILYALGRIPRLNNLNLPRAGVTPAARLLAVNNTQQTNVPHIFAAGDASGPFEIVHIAIQQAEVAARNAARVVRNEDSLEEIDYRLKALVIFTQPELAVAGMSERELLAAERPYYVAQYPYNDHGKAIVMGETEGFVKLIAAQDSREILGAAAIGARASELIHEMIVAMHYRSTAAALAAIPHYHPTLSEIWSYPAESLARR